LQEIAAGLFIEDNDNGEMTMNDLHGLDGLTIQPLARRGFVMTSLISGLTLATARVEAQTIATDSSGIVAGEVKVAVQGGELPAYFAKPEGQGPFPIVLVNEEIFGVHGYIADVCRRLAKQGYAAIAVEIYARLADLTRVSDAGEIIRSVVGKSSDAQIMSDSDAAIAYAAAHGGDAGRVGVVGFCRGGRNSWLYAAHSKTVKAAVAFYGPLGGQVSDLQPKTAGQIAGEINCPVLGLYGGADQGIPADALRKAEADAKAAGKTAEIVIYPDAPHGFHADYRPSYRKEAAEDGWKRMLAWFKRYL
jgi:carboxymethylenebutenolidase